jgi:L-rhamnose isomerase/sugar isomerase
MTQQQPLSDELIEQQNRSHEAALRRDYDVLGEQLERRGVDIQSIATQVAAFGVALPTWGVGTGGTRFARFPGLGEPRNILEKIEDCAVIQQLGQATPKLSPHFPWDSWPDATEVRELASSYGLSFDAVNSNTFQDQPDQQLSYKYGSLTHTDAGVRAQAISHNIDCIDVGKALGSRAITVWIGDGTNFPGQQNLTASLQRYLDSVREIYAALPDGWQLYIEHKLYEPAFYSTVIQDWGTNYLCATELGEKARCLVDLGHHAASVNIEMIVAWLIQFDKLAGFHFNDSKYGDDDLDAGSIQPFQLFLVFNELVDAAYRGAAGFDPAYMLDQSHNVTDPIESLIYSAATVQSMYARALIVDRAGLEGYQQANDALMARDTLVAAFETNVAPLVAMARSRSGGAIDPIASYRASGYRQQKAAERAELASGPAGIV